MKREFPPTRWTLIHQAQDVDGTRRQNALGQLCQIYWYPVYAQVRFRGRTAHEAEDLTQSFFALLLQRRDVNGVSEHKGKFRSFLLKSLTNFLNADIRRNRATKRGGKLAIISLDQALAEERWQDEPKHDLNPEKLYELTWAHTLIQTGLRQLESEYSSNQQADLFEALRDKLLDDPSPSVTKAIAVKFDLSEGAVRLAGFRMRKRLAKILREEISHTLNDPGEVEEEIGYLMNVVAQSHPSSLGRFGKKRS